MAAENLPRIRQRQDFIPDPPHEETAVPVRKIAPSDPALHQGIAPQRVRARRCSAWAYMAWHWRKWLHHSQPLLTSAST